MLKNYLKVAFRNITRNKITSTISILGFAIGFMIVTFIYLFVNNEFSYDTFHKDYKKIFAVRVKSYEKKYANISTAFSEKASNVFTQIEFSAKVLERKTEVKLDSDIYNEIVTFTDSGYFNIFTYELLEGSIPTFKSSPDNVVITHSAANKYFGDELSIGRIISVKLDGTFKDFFVAAVIKDWKDNSSLKPFIIIPYQNTDMISSSKYSKNDWTPAPFAPYYFVKLKDADDKKILESQFQSIIPPEIIKRYGKMEYSMIPLADIHFSNDTNFASISTVSIQTSLILCGIGILILCVISLNFVNLSIAKSSYRFKEIGVRKIIGADRKKIAVQFLGESYFTILLSFLISIVLSRIFLPWFNSITDKNLGLNLLLNIYPLLQMVMIILLVGFAAGIYPSILLSRLNSANILKGQLKLSGPKFISKAFITLQFSVAMFLFSAAVIVNMQYNYIMKKDPGFEKENTIVVKTNEMFGRQIKDGTLKSYRDELIQNTVIKNASLSDMVLGGNERLIGMDGFDFEGKHFFSYIFNFDQQGKETIGLKLKQGRFFSHNIPSDSSNAIVVNEAFVKSMGLKNALNETVVRTFRKQEKIIIGVVKDFNYESIKNEVSPTTFFLPGKKGWTECMYVKYKAGTQQKALEVLKSKWRKFFPDLTFEYSFLDVRIDNLYREETQWKNIINFASVTAVLFSSIGLFGLVLFSIEKRTKEIGIRKILGATVIVIVKSIVAEFALLILAALVISVPPSYLLSEKWLENFAYRVDISWWMFILSGSIALVIALATISIQAVKAASANPVEALKYE